MKLASTFYTVLAAATVSALPGAIVCPTVLSPTIVAVSNNPAVNGLQLTDSSGSVTLTTNGAKSGWNFQNGGIASFEAVGCQNKYLNIVPGSHPWQALSWGTQQITTTWSAAYGQYVGTIPASTTDSVTAFLACRRIAELLTPTSTWNLYLWTGNELPVTPDETLGSDVAIESCVRTRLFVNSSPV